MFRLKNTDEAKIETYAAKIKMYFRESQGGALRSWWVAECQSGFWKHHALQFDGKTWS